MNEFSIALTKLISLLANTTKSSSLQNSPVSQTLLLNSNFSAIQWLGAQNIYPKVYWHSRNSREEVVALGANKFFNSLNEITKLELGQRVWCVCAFPANNLQKNSQYFLPKIELSRFDKDWTIKINLSDNILNDINFLKNLKLEFNKLQPLNCKIVDTFQLPQKPQWLSLIEKALQEIKAQKFKKVVLARQTIINLQEAILPEQLLYASSLVNHHSYHFLFAPDSQNCFLASTPECLFQREGNAVQTEALAGTIGRGQNSMEDIELANWLTHDSKNLREIQFVVDDILERLTPLATQIEVESQARLVRLSKVQHLKREISAQIKPEINFAEVLYALLPTAAVAGLPRKNALEFINNNEPFARGWYSGSFGFVSSHWSEFCVAIRCALINNKQITLYAGAGIVQGSNPEMEWQELDKKTATLLSLIEKL